MSVGVTTDQKQTNISFFRSKLYRTFFRKQPFYPYDINIKKKKPKKQFQASLCFLKDILTVW
jgi:hypothetical protein